LDEDDKPNLIRKPLGSSWSEGGRGCSSWRVIAAEELNHRKEEDNDHSKVTLQAQPMEERKVTHH
jgi:hypothetical protein